MGCIAVVVAIFLYGFLGFIAAWGGLIDFEQTNINLYLFQVPVCCACVQVCLRACLCKFCMS
jgi:hypothetical protein